MFKTIFRKLFPQRTDVDSPKFEFTDKGFEVTSIDYGLAFPFMADWLNEGKTVSL